MESSLIHLTIYYCDKRIKVHISTLAADVKNLQPFSVFRTVDMV